MKKGKLLIIEDVEDEVFGYVRYLEATGFETITATTCEMAKEKFKTEHFDVALVDIELPDGSGLDLLPDMKSLQPEPGAIIITGTGDIPTAVAAMKDGADNFLTKPVNFDELIISIDKCIEIKNLRKQDAYTKRISGSGPLNLGHSPAMEEVKKYASIASQNDSAVLLTGETGTGKGIIAKWIHENSKRASGNFVEVNCSALKGELLRSELYGHARGAFTSAIKDQPGLIESADKGTLFLDEIGDMDLEAQAQLLKTIEEKRFRRIGETIVRNSDFKIICATNKDLSNQVEKGLFRNDLYYRINVFPIKLPKLQDRVEDIPKLVDYFLSFFNYTHSPLSEEIKKALQNHHWNGNIRELRNVVERAILLAGNGPIRLEHLLIESIKKQRSDSKSFTWNLEKQERNAIQNALSYFKGNKSRVCRELGISPSSLYRKLEKYSLSVASEEFSSS